MHSDRSRRGARAGSGCTIDAVLTRRSMLGWVATGAAGLALPHRSTAATPDAGWTPKGTLRIVVPFAAGGTTDLIARMVAPSLAEALGQPVIIENRAGAGGNIGIAAVARSAPDAQTLLFVSTAFVTNPALYPDKPPYDPVRQFAPIGQAVSSPDVIVVRGSSPIRSLADLLARAKQKPGALNYATPGKGNSVHLGGELLWQRAGV